MEQLKQLRGNMKYLPGVPFNENIKVSDNLKDCVTQSDIIVIAVASHAVRDIAKKINPYLKDSQIIVNVAKGIEYNSLQRMSEVILGECPNNDLITLSGPSHAEEVALGLPTTIVVAGESRQKTEFIQDVFMSSTFRVYTNPDVIGVELGGALKNVIALAAGISDGLGYGDNTKAAIMTRGIVEISRLGQKMGANVYTFAGLSGIGDLIVTCTSMHSRNRRAGILLGQGKKVEEVLKEIGMVVEGIRTTYAAYQLSKKMGIEMPITEELFQILYNDGNVKESVERLMLRNKTHEMEEVVLDYYKNW